MKIELSNTNRINKLVRLFGSLSVAATVCLVVPSVAQDSINWKFITDQKIVSFDLSPIGNLIITTKDHIVCLEPATGKKLWKLEGILNRRKDKELKFLSETQYGYISSEHSISILDLDKGEIKWASDQLPSVKNLSSFGRPNPETLLFTGIDENDKDILITVDLSSGVATNETALNFRKDIRRLGFPTENSVLVYGKNSRKNRQIALIDWAHGRTVWTNDTVMQKNPRCVYSTPRKTPSFRNRGTDSKNIICAYKKLCSRLE